MYQTLPHGSKEFNISAYSCVQNIAHQNVLSPENFAKAFLQHILTSIDSKDAVAADAWLSTLLDVIDFVPVRILESEVLPIFTTKAEISKPVKVRLSSCRVLGRLAALLPNPIVTKDVLPVIISLCQDVTAEVRATICRELPNTGKHLSQEDSNMYLITCLVDLSNDEECSVREAVIQAVAQLLQYFPATSMKSTVIPMVKKIFEQSIKNEDFTIIEVARMFGLYCINLKNHLSVDDKDWFLNHYVHLSQLNSTTKRKANKYMLADTSEEEILKQRFSICRQQCAYNFPAMLLFSSDLKSEHLTSLVNVLQNLSSDSFLLVRKSIASGFHEILKLQPKWLPVLRDEFIKFLKDENEVVLEGFIPNIRESLSTLITYCSGFNSGKSDCWREIAQALLICEEMLFSSFNWRLYSEFLSQLDLLPQYFPSELVNEKFVPLLFHRINCSRTLPCRLAATKIVLLIMVNESQIKQKLKLKNKILELCSSSNFYTRMMFIRAMSLLLDISPKLLKEFFFINLISMTEDKVPNIRLAVCKIIPKLKFLALESYNHELLAAIEISVQKLKEEKEKDVLEQIRSMSTELDALGNNKVKMLDFGCDSINSNDKSCSKNMNVGRGKLLPKPIPQPSFLTPTTSRYNSKITFPNSSLKKVLQTSPGKYSAKRVGDTLNNATFIVDAGVHIPNSVELNTTSLNFSTKSETKEISSISKKTAISYFSELVSRSSKLNQTIPTTPRPVHRLSSCTINNSDINSNVTHQDQVKKDELVVPNVNSFVLRVFNKKTDKPSSLPLKVGVYKLPTNKYTTDSSVYSQHKVKSEQKLSPKTTKRLSLDVDSISNRAVKTPSKYTNVNKRYSLNVEIKKEHQNILTPSSNMIGSSSLGSKVQTRPQSCVLKNLETETIDEPKRSLSVENLPPKTQRPASRLPVRSVDSKSSKTK